MNHRVYSNIMKKVIGENKKSDEIYICCYLYFHVLMVLRYKSEVIRYRVHILFKKCCNYKPSRYLLLHVSIKQTWFYVTQQYSRIYIILISGFYGGRGGGSPKWKHDKYEEVVQMEEPSSTTDN